MATEYALNVHDVASALDGADLVLAGMGRLAAEREAEALARDAAEVAREHGITFANAFEWLLCMRSK